MSIRIIIEDEDIGRDLMSDLLGMPAWVRDVNRQLRRLLREEETQTIDLAVLTAKVTAGTELDESIKALIEGIAEELDTDPNPKILALSAKLKESARTLSEAVHANT